MLTFTYNLRFFKGGASMKDVEGGNRGGRERGDFQGPGPGMMDGGIPPGMPMPPGGGR